MQPFGILEIARTGKVALQRASGVNSESLKLRNSGSYLPT
jgi:acetolactate synthase-1/3 small subunit